MCAKCYGSGYVQAPDDNAWKRYFARIGRARQSVLVDCPECKPEQPKPRKRSAS